MATTRWMRWLLAGVLTVGGASGCATLPEGQSAWGSEATLTPGWDRVRDAAIGAAKDPQVWVPLAGAAVFSIGDFDEEVSDWAREETPIFGSQENARDWSDHLKSASAVSYWITALATPSGDEDWFANKAKGIAVGLSARALTSWTTSGLKDAIGRERPDGSDDMSMPSGHSSAAAVNSRLASRNLDHIPMSRNARRALNGGLLALSLGTGWARVEAGKHYPSDTLAGMALDNWFAMFVNDAFLGHDAGDTMGVTLEAVPDGAIVRFYRIY